MADESPEVVDVVVVGGGLSGLSAAWRLREAGVSVTVLEAQSRVGGRTLSLPVPGSSGGSAEFDFGGEYVGTTQVHLIELCRDVLGWDMDFGADGQPPPSSIVRGTYNQGLTVVHLDGKRSEGSGDSVIPPGLGFVDAASLWWLLRRIRRLHEHVATGADQPWMLPDAGALDAMSVEQFVTSSGLFTARAREMLRIGVRAIWSVEASDISLLFFLWYVASAGSLESLIDCRPVTGAAQGYRLRPGTQQVSKELAARLGAVVRLATPVRRIEHDAIGVLVACDDHRYRAGHVIVATTPAVAGKIEYLPALPKDRVALTDGLRLGRTLKCILTYRQPYWRERFSGMYVGNLDPLTWTMDNEANNGTPAIMAFVVGRNADRMHGLPRETRQAEVTNALREIFQDERMLKPTAYVDMDWASSPWSLGGPTGVMEPGRLTKCGAALCIPCGRVFWAGTETAGRWMGYMTGAVEAGYVAAERVLRARGQ